LISSPSTESRISALRWLFDALAASGREPIITPDDCQDYLNRQPGMRQTSITRWFLAALRYEWHAPEPPTVLGITLAGDVRRYLESREGPWATVWGHIQRVAGNALWLARRGDVDLEAVYLAALYHDAGKLDELEAGRPHAELGAEMAWRALRGKMPADTLQAIDDAIQIHPDPPSSSWKVACVLHDADKLDKVGAAGLARRLSAAANHADACLGAYRTLDEAETLPAFALPASEALLRPKLAFARTLGKLIDGVCE
jgi:putative nucleotidyltransferase with HDIG domain